MAGRLIDSKKAQEPASIQIENLLFIFVGNKTDFYPSGSSSVILFEVEGDSVFQTLCQVMAGHVFPAQLAPKHQTYMGTGRILCALRNSPTTCPVPTYLGWCRGRS